MAFGNLIKTDGHTADVLVLKSTRVNASDYADCCRQDVDISSLGDAMKDEDLSKVSLCGLDPGRGQVFTASYGSGEESHEIRRCSTREYYAYTGSRRHERKERRRMQDSNMQDVFLNLPTTKTARLSTYLRYQAYVLLHLTRMLHFYDLSTAESRLHLYQGVQRARQEMANILINGGRKYNKAKRKNTRKNRKKRRKKRKARAAANTAANAAATAGKR
jgi:hypothetical protein